MLNWCRRAGPLPVDALTALVQEQARVTGARMELRDGRRDRRAVGVEPGSVANPVPRVRRLVALLTKKLNEEPDGDVGVSSSQLAPVTAPSTIRV